jgi:hydrogenase maturation protease
MDRFAQVPIQMLSVSRTSNFDDRGAGVLVVGLGNTLLSDDGVGIHVVRRLSSDPHAPTFLQALDGGTLGFRLMEAVAQSDAALFIDAAELGQPPGTIRLFEQEALDLYTRRGERVSAHEAGLVDLLTLARMDGWAPEHVAVLGIQPQRIDWGERLSEAVARALPDACHIAVDTVRRWRRPS